MRLHSRRLVHHVAKADRARLYRVTLMGFRAPGEHVPKGGDSWVKESYGWEPSLRAAARKARIEILRWEESGRSEIECDIQYIYAPYHSVSPETAREHLGFESTPLAPIYKEEA